MKSRGSRKAVAAEIFAAHLALLKDHGFVERIRARIERDRVNVIEFH